MPYLVIDTETGEGLYEIHVGDRIVRSSSAERFKREQTETSGLMKGAHFVKLYDTAAELAAEDEIGVSGLRLLFFLMPRVQYESCVVVGAAGEPLSAEGIAACFGRDVRSVQRGLAELVEAQVLARGTCGRRKCYLMNPYFMMRGTRVNKTLEAVFYGSKWKKKAERRNSRKEEAGKDGGGEER